MKQLIIMQGISGSGKSTFVKAFKKKNDIVLSTDDYFIDDDGNYNFDESKLKEYHMKTFTECVNKMQDTNRPEKVIKGILGDVTIWLDNTNCKNKDVDPYISVAKLNGFKVFHIRADVTVTPLLNSKAPTEVVEQQKKDLDKYDYNHNAYWDRKD
tara:strand:- start:918 stop:1382 length:465 start_codon:yes stop_codon:yes gene_type:complete